MKKIQILRGIAGITAFLLLFTVSASTLMFQYDSVINEHLNLRTTKVVQAEAGEPANTAYYTSEYGADFTNKQKTLELELDVAAEIIAQNEEGTVLLRNIDSALPLPETSRVTLFGNASKTSGTSSVAAVDPASYTSALQKVLGEDSVNTVLIDEVYSALGNTSATQVVEAPISDVIAHEDTWQSDYNDAAIVVFTRNGGEDSDTALYGEDGSHFLGLQENERELMDYLAEQKASGVFDRIIVVIHSMQGMELDWMDTYGVDACLLTAEPGVTGLNGVANVMVGKVNPSGKTVNTYAANSLSAPAMTNAITNSHTWSNVEEVNANCADVGADGATIDHYVVYAEGIYVGYKYYETRYEDSVLNQGNADSAVGSSQDGEWDYTQEVVYPFGYGLSYTTFEQNIDSVEYNSETDSYEVEVTVTNTGDVAGKSVVEVYAQTPYGDYEKENRVEKAAVQLVGFDKTKTLEPGEQETLNVQVRRYMLASYDAEGAEGYILSAGPYYLAIGNGAHDALNNILAAKGYTTEAGMDYNGDASKTYTWEQEELDTETYRFSSITGNEITNRFDNADLNYYGVECTYLSRQDWEGTYPVAPIPVTVNEQMLADLSMNWYEKPEDAPGVSDFTQGVDNGLSFADMRLVDLDDDETWNRFLDQLTVEEMAGQMQDGQGVEGIPHVGLPSQVRSNDLFSAGTMVATGENALTWPAEPVTSRTWNDERMTTRGHLMGIESAFCGKNENWYGGGNFHRTPFGGRMRHYYSEDGNFSYLAGAYEAAAMQDTGVIYCIKHFVLNDQETYRQGISTFVNEQALRELYLRAFEGAFVEGGAMSVMLGFNRVGVVYTAASEPLLQGILRDEWGFEGRITTDGFSSGFKYETHCPEMFEAGVTYFCLDTSYTGPQMLELIENGDGNMLRNLREMTKYNIYAASRSVSVNGLGDGGTIVTVVPWWETALVGLAAVSAAGLIISVAGCIVVLSGEKKKGAKEDERA